MHSVKDKALQVRAFLLVRGRPPSRADKSLMWCVCPPSPLLWQAPRLPWCIPCAFHIGSTALLLGVPYMSSLLPPVRLVMFLCLPYTGPIWGGPARSRRRVRCIYCPRDPWLYLFRPCHIGPPGSGSQWICFVWGLVKGTVKRLSPPPLVSASAPSSPLPPSIHPHIRRPDPARQQELRQVCWLCSWNF